MTEKCKICGKNIKGTGEFRHCPLGHFPDKEVKVQICEYYASEGKKLCDPPCKLCDRVLKKTDPKKPQAVSEEEMEKFMKKGEIKRRIIQGDIELAFDMEKVVNLCKSLYQKNKELEEKLKSAFDVIENYARQDAEKKADKFLSLFSSQQSNE